MSSQRRIDASRANGARSRGPVTADGKERSARNAVRHGLLANNIVITGENAEHFQTLLEAYLLRFQPVDSVETSLVQQMAAADWRQQRAWAIETAIMNEKIAASSSTNPLTRMTDAFALLATGPELPLMHRYESRQSRLYYRALHNLQLLRRADRSLDPDPEPPAAEFANEELPNEPNPNSEHSGEPALPVAAAPPAPAPDPARIPQHRPFAAPVPLVPAPPLPPALAGVDFDAVCRLLRKQGVPGF